MKNKCDVKGCERNARVKIEVSGKINKFCILHSQGKKVEDIRGSI